MRVVLDSHLKDVDRTGRKEKLYNDYKHRRSPFYNGHKRRDLDFTTITSEETHIVQQLQVKESNFSEITRAEFVLCQTVNMRKIVQNLLLSADLFEVLSINRMDEVCLARSDYSGKCWDWILEERIPLPSQISWKARLLVSVHWMFAVWLHNQTHLLSSKSSQFLNALHITLDTALSALKIFSAQNHHNFRMHSTSLRH